MRGSETHIAICGHAKHGKSTLAGRLLYELGAVSEDGLAKLREEAADRGKDFNEFSLVFLRQRTSTFERGAARVDDASRTVFPARGNVALSPDQLLTLIDTPGYSRFLDNIIYGVHLADLAILVVEASSGVELGTVRVARIISSFAIPTIAVFVTKMDVVGYSELRFLEVKEEIEELVIPILNRSQEVPPPIVPISALTGVGFRDPAGKLEWHNGPSGLQLIENARIKTPVGAASPVRLVVEGPNEVFSPPGVGTVLVGTLETGCLTVGDDLAIEPASTKEGRSVRAHIRSLRRAKSVADMGPEDLHSIAARAIVSAATSSLTRAEARRYLNHGGILGPATSPPRVATRFEAELVFFEPHTLYSGKDYVIHANASQGVARVMAVESPLSASLRTGPLVRKKSTRVYDLQLDEYDATANETARATLALKGPICIEAGLEFQRLTRFLLRESNTVVACGRCLAVTA